MRNATLRQLKIFAAVARHLSFARAAEELHLTQPAVSGQIKKLEEHAGVPLFEQVGKKTHLTAAGADLVGIVRAIVEQFEAADHAMTQHKGVSGGRLNVAVISAGDYFLPRLLVGSSAATRASRSTSRCTTARACSPTSPPTSLISRSWPGRRPTTSWSASRSRRIPT
jgi:DNA-binding transcriptional LysR family regulator